MIGWSAGCSWTARSRACSSTTPPPLALSTWSRCVIGIVLCVARKTPSEVLSASTGMIAGASFAFQQAAGRVAAPTHFLTSDIHGDVGLPGVVETRQSDAFGVRQSLERHTSAFLEDPQRLSDRTVRAVGGDAGVRVTAQVGDEAVAHRPAVQDRQSPCRCGRGTRGSACAPPGSSSRTSSMATTGSGTMPFLLLDDRRGRQAEGKDPPTVGEPAGVVGDRPSLVVRGLELLGLHRLHVVGPRQAVGRGRPGRAPRPAPGSGRGAPLVCASPTWVTQTSPSRSKSKTRPWSTRRNWSLVNRTCRRSPP